MNESYTATILAESEMYVSASSIHSAEELIRKHLERVPYKWKLLSISKDKIETEKLSFKRPEFTPTGDDVA